MNLVMQPEGSNLCGQSCVAMVAGVNLEQSIAAFGSKGKTATRDLIRAMAALNVRCSSKIVRMSKHIKIPTTCIMRIAWHDRYKRRYLHWIVSHAGRIYDPATGIWGRYPDEFGKITALLEVTI